MLRRYIESARARWPCRVINGLCGTRQMVETRLLLGLLLAASACVACSAETSEKPASAWTQFVHVDGQPDPVPVQWVSTPQGKFAHSIKIPNPVPEDSGYRKGMSSQEYFDHLCKTEAGEFIFKTVDGVEGFYFARPPKRPTTNQLKDPYMLEAPEIERSFQLLKATSKERGTVFIDPPWRVFSFVEEPNTVAAHGGNIYIRVLGFRQGVSPMQTESVSKLKSKYGLVWRGIRRANDRALAIAGSELIVIELRSSEVLAVQRNYARTGFDRRNSGGIWWPTALGCPAMQPRDSLPMRFYRFIIKSLTPQSQNAK